MESEMDANESHSNKSRFEKNNELIAILQEMPEGPEKEQLIEQYIDNLFKLPIFQNVEPPPEPSGSVKYLVKKMSIDISKKPWNSRGRLFGPRGSTVEATEKYSECEVDLGFFFPCKMYACISVRDYENVGNWKIEKAKMFIEELFKVPEDKNEDVVLKLQMDELAVRRQNFENRLPPPTCETDDDSSLEEGELQSSDEMSFSDSGKESGNEEEPFGENELNDDDESLNEAAYCKLSSSTDPEGYFLARIAAVENYMHNLNLEDASSTLFNLTSWTVEQVIHKNKTSRVFANYCESRLFSLAANLLLFKSTSVHGADKYRTMMNCIYTYFQVILHGAPSVEEFCKQSNSSWAVDLNFIVLEAYRMTAEIENKFSMESLKRDFGKPSMREHLNEAFKLLFPRKLYTENAGCLFYIDVGKRLQNFEKLTRSDISFYFNKYMTTGHHSDTLERCVWIMLLFQEKPHDFVDFQRKVDGCPVSIGLLRSSLFLFIVENMTLPLVVDEISTSTSATTLCHLDVMVFFHISMHGARFSFARDGIQKLILPFMLCKPPITTWQRQFFSCLQSILNGGMLNDADNDLFILALETLRATSYSITDLLLAFTTGEMLEITVEFAFSFKFAYLLFDLVTKTFFINMLDRVILENKEKQMSVFEISAYASNYWNWIRKSCKEKLGNMKPPREIPPQKLWEPILAVREEYYEFATFYLARACFMRKDFSQALSLLNASPINLGHLLKSKIYQLFCETLDKETSKELGYAESAIAEMNAYSSCNSKIKMFEQKALYSVVEYLWKSEKDLHPKIVVRDAKDNSEELSKKMVKSDNEIPLLDKIKEPLQCRIDLVNRLLDNLERYVDNLTEERTTANVDLVCGERFQAMQTAAFVCYGVSSQVMNLHQNLMMRLQDTMNICTRLDSEMQNMVNSFGDILNLNMQIASENRGNISEEEGKNN
ncbi:hypothetical protein T12_8085 [Trichinella patagoniensis]|uniref:Uncharacterized protein n=1 Tax=Trichinella patagoniensis TaxID=990121 RepID=A0A0V1AAM5_9BILA|nr:hypothetical protein T12_8085 [Trichinella patagoniensis]